MQTQTVRFLRYTRSRCACSKCLVSLFPGSLGQGVQINVKSRYLPIREVRQIVASLRAHDDKLPVAEAYSRTQQSRKRLRGIDSDDAKVRARKSRIGGSAQMRPVAFRTDGSREDGM